MNQEFYEEYVEWYKNQFDGRHPKEKYAGVLIIDELLAFRKHDQNPTKEDLENTTQERIDERLKITRILTYEEYCQEFKK
jgi:hypothetical protein